MEPPETADAPGPGVRGADPSPPPPEPPRRGEEASAPAVPTARKGRFARNELMALGGFALLGLIAAIWFFRCLYAHPAEVGVPEVAKHFPHPLKGRLVTLDRIETGWRNRVETDRVRAEEVILPTLQLKLNPAGSSRGFVRVEFIDSEGKIRGDISTVEFEGGRFKDGGRGEQVGADATEVTLSGTVGFSSRSLFTIYRGGEETRWSIRLREGADYSNGPWSVIGQAQISDQKP